VVSLFDYQIKTRDKFRFSWESLLHVQGKKNNLKEEQNVDWLVSMRSSATPTPCKWKTRAGIETWISCLSRIQLGPFGGYFHDQISKHESFENFDSVVIMHEDCNVCTGHYRVSIITVLVFYNVSLQAVWRFLAVLAEQELDRLVHLTVATWAPLAFSFSDFFA